jgi:hypothetical protein
VGFCVFVAHAHFTRIHQFFVFLDDIFHANIDLILVSGRVVA